jgi:hypothetical protein
VSKIGYAVMSCRRNCLQAMQPCHITDARCSIRCTHNRIRCNMNLHVHLLLLLLPQGTCRSDVNDGIISRPRLLARDPSLFSLLQYIFSPSVVRMRYRSVCPACSTKWTPEAQVPLLEPAPPVSGAAGSSKRSAVRMLHEDTATPCIARALHAVTISCVMATNDVTVVWGLADSMAVMCRCRHPRSNCHWRAALATPATGGQCPTLHLTATTWNRTAGHGP